MKVNAKALEIMSDVVWMDTQLRKNLDDENLFEEWLICGVPDHIGENIDIDDLYTYVEDPTAYAELKELFYDLCERAGI